MPDYFKDSPGDPNWYPTDTEEKARLLQKFKIEKAFTPNNLPMVIQSAVDAKLRWPSVHGWGVFGLCWGGKVK
jgi:dienelactone hydrolase